MSGRSSANDDRRPARVFQAVERLCDGRDVSTTALLQLLPTGPEQLTEMLINAAVRHAGTRQSQKICGRHLRQRNWAKWLPLTCLEYGTLLGKNPGFELGIRAALARSGWANRHRRELERARRPHVAAGAAQALLGDLDAIAIAASDVLPRVAERRAQIEPPLHAVPVQALPRTEEALGDLRGMRALDIAVRPARSSMRCEGAGPQW
ncbi:MAG: hypothetical protein HY901_19540 [Deltaproteobacteria bacterium]|nr:hypothetical protein [Deltaproteobacteria bacterium]